MILPVLSYGHRILRQKCKEISPDYPDLELLVNNLWDTMNNDNGCGLAAPQVGIAVRLFIVDSKITFENIDPEDQEFYFVKGDTGIRETFINAKILDYSGHSWEDEEGCLSIPNMSQKVKRPWSITIDYCDKDFNRQVKTYEGSTARVIQHEYDHTDGILYIDHLSPLTRRLIDGRLKRISKGQIPANYLMTYIK